MKNISKRLISSLLALTLISCAAGCQNKDENNALSSVPLKIATVDEPTAASSEPDIGEHKDYGEEFAKISESGSIIIVDQDDTKRGLELFEMTLGSGCLEFYANELNKTKDLVGNKVNVYSMIIPTACELYTPKNQRKNIDSQAQLIEDVKDMLVEVKLVDVFPTLTAHNAENIYYRTDSRWTPLGAYYAGKVFAQTAGVPYADISEYAPTTPKDYLGDLIYMCDSAGSATLESVPDKFSYYTPKTGFKTNYYDDQFEYLVTDKFYSEVEDSLYKGYYKGGYYSLRIDTNVKNDRKLLLIKDDFGTVMPTFFTSSFSEIYVISYDYFGANIIEMIQEFGITDVLYAMNAFTISDERVYTLETLRSQATHGNLNDDAPKDEDNDSYDSSDSDTEKGSDTDDCDSIDDSDNISSEIEYIYGVGINNQIGIAGSDTDLPLTTESTASEYSEYGDDFGGNEADAGEYGYDDGYDDSYDDNYDY